MLGAITCLRANGTKPAAVDDLGIVLVFFIKTTLIPFLFILNEHIINNTVGLII